MRKVTGWGRVAVRKLGWEQPDRWKAAAVTREGQDPGETQQAWDRSLRTD